MSISFQSFSGLFEKALSLRSQRASVLAGNLANADTPNYKARDFNFHAALKGAGAAATAPNGQLLLTHQEHFQVFGGQGSPGLQFRSPTQPSIDGNTVEEQVEHAAFMENTLEFQAAFTLLNNRFKGLSGAIKGE
jgi:flagellar basal-body rod protein FlgB